MLDALSLREGEKRRGADASSRKTRGADRKNSNGEEGYEEDAIAEEQMEVAKLLHKKLPKRLGPQLHGKTRESDFVCGWRDAFYVARHLCCSSMRFAKELLSEREMEERKQHPTAKDDQESTGKPKRTSKNWKFSKAPPNNFEEDVTNHAIRGTLF